MSCDTRQQRQKYLHTDAPWLLIGALRTGYTTCKRRAHWAEMYSAPQTSYLPPELSCSMHGTVWLAFHTDLQLPWVLTSHRIGYEKAGQCWEIDAPSVSHSSMDASGHSTVAKSKNRSGTPEFRDHLNPLLLFIR